MSFLRQLKNKLICFSGILRYQSQPQERVLEYKFLGIQFNENLNWTYHVNSLKQSIARNNGMFTRFRLLLPVNL